MKRCLLLFLASLAFSLTFSQTLRPDPAFGPNGLATTSSVANFSCAIQQSDGKVMAAIGSGGGLTVVRFNADGTLDNTFGTNGTAFVPVSGSIPWPYTIGNYPAGSYGSPTANSVAVNKDGQIAVVGSVVYGGGWTSSGLGYVAAFFNADGTPARVDVRVNPYYTGDIYTSRSSASSVTVQNDGKFVVLGEEQLISGLGSIRGTEFIVARYNANGLLEREVRTPIPRNIRFIEGQMHAYSITVQSNGQIIVAGEGGNDTAPLFPPIESLGRVLLRYNADLSLDKTFGRDGIAYTPFLINFSDRTIAVQNDGKIVAVGTVGSALAVARYNANGSLDSSFGNGGTVSTGLPSGTYIPSLPPLIKIPSAISILGDRKIIVAARSSSTFSVVLLNSDGSFDNSFDGDGITSTTVNMSIVNTFISPNRVYAVGSSQGMGAVAAFNVVTTCTAPTFLNNGFIVLNAECGKSNGNISIIPLTGTAPYQYSINGGASYVSGPAQGLTFYDLAKGTYQLRLKDAGGCESEIVQREVQETGCPSCTTLPTFLNDGTIVKDDSCGTANGNISIIPTSGTAPFLYSINGGQTYASGPDDGYTFYGLAAGTYQLRLKDAGGCQSDVVQREVKTTCPTPVCTPPTFLNNGMIVQNATCGNSDGALYMIPTSGTAPYQYSKNGGQSYVSGPDAGYTFSGLAAGTYQLRMKDASGCESALVAKEVKAPDCSLTCTPPTFLNNSMIVGHASCGGSDGSLSIIPTSGTAPFLYSKDGGATYVSGPASGYTFQNLAPGTYQLRLKDASGCESAVVEKTVLALYGTCAGMAPKATATEEMSTGGQTGVMAYPNPSKGVFRLQFSGPAGEKVQLTILDVKGALVQQTQLNVQKGSTIDVDLSSKAKGLYLIRVVSEKGTQQTKVLIQ